MGSSWTIQDIERLKNKGLIIIDSDNKKSVAAAEKKIITIPREEPKELKEMKQLLMFMKIDFETEYKFLRDRKFRFDIAIVQIKLAVEYEGLFSEKSGHTTMGGFIRNCEKYNLAVLEGWRLLRYTANTYKQFFKDINRVI